MIVAPSIGFEATWIPVPPFSRWEYTVLAPSPQTPKLARSLDMAAGWLSVVCLRLTNPHNFTYKGGA